jgi:hypothetical protein
MTAQSAASSRFMIRNTVAACHGVDCFRASNSRATARADMPLATHSAIIGASALARALAAACANPR